MEKFLIWFSGVIFILTLSILAWTVLWKQYLEHYWYSDIYKVYQSEDIVRLCNGTDPIEFSWNLSIQNNTLVDNSTRDAQNGIPITLIGRGFYNEEKTPHEIYFHEFYSIKSGVNPDCQKTEFKKK